MMKSHLAVDACGFTINADTTGGQMHRGDINPE